MTTTNLALPEVTAAQNQKEVTINDAFEGIDNATQAFSTKSLSATSETITSEDFVGSFAHQFTGSPGGALTIDVPATQRLFFVDNQTDQTATVQVSGGAGATLEVTATQGMLIYSDGADLTAVSSAAGGSGTSSGGTSQSLDVSMFIPGVMADADLLTQIIVATEFVCPSGLTGSVGVAGVAATAETILTIKKNGSSVGTITFAASGTVPSFIMASETTFEAGSILTIEGPTTADTTLANVSVSLKGTRT